MSYISLVA